MINQDSKNVKTESRPNLKARQHALRHCECERKVVNMFSKKTPYGMFLESRKSKIFENSEISRFPRHEQRANLIKLSESLAGKAW